MIVEGLQSLGVTGYWQKVLAARIANYNPKFYVIGCVGDSVRDT